MRLFLLYISLIFISISYAGNPVKEYRDHPGNSEFKFEELELSTSDSFKLKSWIIFPKEENDLKRVMVLAYGDSGNMSFWIPQALEIVKKGYTLLLFDYRGFGESQHFAVEQNMFYYDEFIKDLSAAVQYAKSRFNQPIGVWALSTGTIVATQVFAEIEYDFLVAEGFIADPLKAVKLIKEHMDMTYEVPESAKVHEKVLSYLSLPVLFFAGDRDGLGDPNDSYRIRYLNPKSDVMLYRGGHLQGFQALSQDYHGQRYVEALESFVDSLFVEKSNEDVKTSKR